MIDKYMMEIESNYNIIQQVRKEIADLKAEKIIARAEAWQDATGTAKEKEDFVRSVVADIDKEIAYKEANIEYLYNRTNFLNDELVFSNE